jgi:hypothetical protein
MAPRPSATTWLSALSISSGRRHRVLARPPFGERQSLHAEHEFERQQRERDRHGASSHHSGSTSVLIETEPSKKLAAAPPSLQPLLAHGRNRFDLEDVNVHQPDYQTDAHKH